MIVRQQVARATTTKLTYPGTPESVPAVRRLVRAILAHSPRVDDLELIAAELVTNAIHHTPSGSEGGAFTITLGQEPGRAWLEVADLGNEPWRPAQSNGDGMAEHGRGLEIVTALADDVGYGVSDGHNRFSWATLSWLPPGLVGLSARPSKAQELRSGGWMPHLLADLGGNAGGRHPVRRGHCHTTMDRQETVPRGRWAPRPGTTAIRVPAA
jgi:anti-sigma regulatory factor (Ser/Thr protein kinase)